MATMILPLRAHPVAQALSRHTISQGQNAHRVEMEPLTTTMTQLALAWCVSMLVSTCLKEALVNVQTLNAPREPLITITMLRHLADPSARFAHARVKLYLAPALDLKHFHEDFLKIPRALTLPIMNFLLSMC